MHNKRIGAIGENAAFLFLERKGYKNIIKNILTPFGEIDLIARDNDTVVFIEVKTIVSGFGSNPFENITNNKIRHIFKNVIYYIKEHNLHNLSCRIDAIGIRLGPDHKIETLDHVTNIVDASEWGYTI